MKQSEMRKLDVSCFERRVSYHQPTGSDWKQLSIGRASGHVIRNACRRRIKQRKHSLQRGAMAISVLRQPDKMATAAILGGSIGKRRATPWTSSRNEASRAVATSRQSAASIIGDSRHIYRGSIDENPVSGTLSFTTCHDRTQSSEVD